MFFLNINNNGIPYTLVSEHLTLKDFALEKIALKKIEELLDVENRDPGEVEKKMKLFSTVEETLAMLAMSAGSLMCKQKSNT